MVGVCKEGLGKMDLLSEEWWVQGNKAYCSIQRLAEDKKVHKVGQASRACNRRKGRFSRYDNAIDAMSIWRHEFHK
jgi:hypothetical protein